MLSIIILSNTIFVDRIRNAALKSKLITVCISTLSVSHGHSPIAGFRHKTVTISSPGIKTYC